MTEASKEAVEVLAEILMSSFPEVNFIGLDMSVDFIDRLSKQGFTIAPIAPVTDEKLREAVDLVKYYHSGNSVACDELSDAMQTIYATLTELTELRAAMTWQPIDTAPKDRTRVLLFVPPYGVSTGHYSQEFGKWSCHSLLNKDAVPTHWMPLPTPPKED